MRVLDVVEEPAYLPPLALDRVPVECFVEILPAGKCQSMFRVLMLRPGPVVYGAVDGVALLAYAFYQGRGKRLN